MDLSAYLARIGFDGPVRPDLPTLKVVHLRHGNAIPFENLDVQLGQPGTTDLALAFDKLVTRRRGGWCYEQNGLFGWALGQIGFEVMRVSAGVARETAGDGQMGNHLCLLVRLEDGVWLADVGFGHSLETPLRLETAERRDAPYTLGLSLTDDGYWRFRDSDGGAPSSFDFRPEPAGEDLLSAKCHELGVRSSSPFVQNLVVQRRQGDRHFTLRGRVLSEAGVGTKHILHSPDELVDVLRTRFDLHVPQAADLWPAICARHEALGLPENSYPAAKT
ncbi:MAG: arylamine N-acetyltransferase [Asticcacaulis sp.]|nr:arylamine N-acetyltransferase [Asticcacaulis sp.]